MKELHKLKFNINGCRITVANPNIVAPTSTPTLTFSDTNYFSGALCLPFFLFSSDLISSNTFPAWSDEGSYKNKKTHWFYFLLLLAHSQVYFIPSQVSAAGVKTMVEHHFSM